MTDLAQSQTLRATLPELARRLMAILGPLAAVVAAEFLRRPDLMGFIRPLWAKLMQVGRRFAAVRLETRKRVRRMPEGPVEPSERAKAPPRLPITQGWLVKELGYKAAGYASQLSHLLDDAAMRAALDAAPGFGKILRPVCWMLGISRDKATSRAELAAERLDREGKPVPRRRDQPWPPPGKTMVPITVLYPPAEPRVRTPPEIAWNFTKWR